MGLRLITEDEKQVLEGEGYNIDYRRIPNQVRGRIISKNTKKGDVNWSKASIEMLEYSVTGWDDGVTEEIDGKITPVKFATSKVKFIPNDVQEELLEKIGANIEGRGDDVDEEPLPN